MKLIIIHFKLIIIYHIAIRLYYMNQLSVWNDILVTANLINFHKNMKYLKISITFIYIMFLFEWTKNIFFHAYHLYAFVYIFVIEFHKNCKYFYNSYNYTILETNARTILRSKGWIFSDILQLFVIIIHV